MGFLWKEPKFFEQGKPLHYSLVITHVVLATCFVIVAATGEMLINPILQGSLGIEGSDIQWIAILMLLAVNSTVPIANQIALRYGHKFMYIVGLLFFIFGSICTLFSYDFYSMSFSRILEGIGGGIIFPVGLSLVLRDVPQEKRSLAINLYMGLGFGGGMVASTLIGGAFAQHNLWREFFALLIPVNCLLAAFAVILFDETRNIEKKAFDYAGYFAFITFIGSLIIALENGNLPSTDGGWRDPLVINCFFVALVSLVLGIYFELKAKNPIIPLSMFKDPAFSIGSLTLFIVGASIFATIEMILMTLEIGLGYQKWTIGLLCTSYGLSLGVFSILTSYVSKYVPALFLSLVGLCLLIASYLIASIITFQSSHGIFVLMLILRGAGVGVALGPTTLHALKNIPQELLDKAATFLTFFRQVGATYGGVIISIIMIRKTIFHTARYAEQVVTFGPSYTNYLHRLSQHIQTQVHNPLFDSSMQAKKLLTAFIKKQALLSGINDGLILIGWVTIIVSCLLLLIQALRLLKNRFQK